MIIMKHHDPLLAGSCQDRHVHARQGEVQLINMLLNTLDAIVHQNSSKIPLGLTVGGPCPPAPPM